MKLFLLLIAFAITSLVSAQDVIHRSTADKSANKVDLQMIDIPVPTFSGLDKLIIDTVYGPAYDLACSETSQIFSSSNGGFVSGSNGYGDLEKIQRIVLDQDYTFEVTNALAVLLLDSAALVNNSLNDLKLVANVFTELPNDSTFGNFLGASDTILIGSLNFNDNGLAAANFTFSTAPQLTDAGSFLIGIDFSDVYNRTAPGHIGIISTNDGCGSGANTYETFINSAGGLSFGDIVTDWQGLNLEFLLGAVIDREPALATRTPLANYGATASPNPATNDLSINFNAPGNEQLTASLLTTDGRVVRSQSVRAGAGRVEWAVADLPAGLYLYQLAGLAGVQTGKVVVR